MRPRPDSSALAFALAAVATALAAAPHATLAASSTSRPRPAGRSVVAKASPARTSTPAAPPPRRPEELSLDRGVSVRLEGGREILLSFTAGSGDGWKNLAEIYGGAPDSWRGMRDGLGHGKDPVRGARYVLPFSDLSESWKVRALRALFPADRFEGDEWEHRPASSPVETYGEGLWQVAAWFTGDGEHFRDLSRSGASLDPAVGPGEIIRIPASLLRPGLRRPSDSAPDAPSDPPAPENQPAAEGGRPDGERPAPTAPSDLTYGQDAAGRYAIYRLKSGEAIYSAVAARFTGRVDPDEVNEAAGEIARASGIKSVMSIPVGFPIRIPISMLLPEFLPEGDPRRDEADRSAAEAARYQNPERARNLEGVHVVLDAGHGGVDHGAEANGVNEHEYVYDVMCRLKRRLESETAATVHPLIEDSATGFRPRDSRTLSPDGDERLLTDPPHSNGDPSQTTLGVNLRWYLANSILRKLKAEKVPSQRVVFISLHADSLHPSLSGGMVYIPGERFRRGTFGFDGPMYARYREVREQPYVSVSRTEGARSEGLSREFAGYTIDALARRGLGVHPYMPVRDRIIRHNRAWVPAVLRANEIPVKILFEVANLNNTGDARRIRDWHFREKTAQAIEDALLRYYRSP